MTENHTCNHYFIGIGLVIIESYPFKPYEGEDQLACINQGQIMQDTEPDKIGPVRVVTSTISSDYKNDS